MPDEHSGKSSPALFSVGSSQIFTEDIQGTGCWKLNRAQNTGGLVAECKCGTLQANNGDS